MDSTLTEVLKPSTLMYMQNVHWTDPDWSTTWGLGFNVSKGDDGEKWVGHGGSCPGYRSTLQILPGSKRAYSVMINASGTSPGKYTSGIHAILEKVKDPEEDDTSVDQESGPGLSEYEGYFNPMPWGSELYVASWYGKLAILYLPTSSPGEAITFYKQIDRDLFRRERDNGELGEALVFERDESGKITRFKRHGNYTVKLSR
jgi:hypothetical protein